MDKALIYLRVSTESQFRKENPIGTQKEACLEYAQRMGYEVGEKEIYVDGGESGRTDARKAYKELMQRVKEDASIKAVVAFDISRISRNLPIYLEFKKSLGKRGVKFLSVSEPFLGDAHPANKMLEQVLASFAEFRSGQDGEKIKAAMRWKAESGIYPGKARFGYRNVRGADYGGKEKRWMEVNKTESIWVEKAFRMYASEEFSLSQLSDKLAKEGFPTRDGKPLAVSSLVEILKNKIYIGHIEWGGVVNPNGRHDKLISEEIFYRVQAILESRMHGSDRIRKHNFLLRGFLWCGECGGRVNASYHRSHTGKRYAHYGCQKRKNNQKVECSQPVVSLEELENQFSNLISRLELSPSLSEKLVNKVKAVAGEHEVFHRKAKDTVSKEIDSIAIKKKALLEKYVDGNIADEEYADFKASLEEKEAKLKAELAKVENRLEESVRTLETAIKLASNLYKAFLSASPTSQKLMAKVIFERIVVKDQKIVEAQLAHPIAFVCKYKASRSPVFQYQYNGGDGRTTLEIYEYLRQLPQFVKPGLVESCVEQLKL